MAERFYFHVLYVGSAAMVAFLAACLSSPGIATFRCDTGAEQCELVETVAASATAASGASSENRAVPGSGEVSMAQASAD